MSRHRNFKGNNLEYSDCESNSISFTDDEQCYGASPNTMELYMYDESKSGNSRTLSNFINYKPSLDFDEDCFPDNDEMISKNDIKINETRGVIKNPVESLNVNINTQLKINCQIPETNGSKNEEQLKLPIDKVKDLDENNSRSGSRERRSKLQRPNKEIEKVEYDPTEALKAYSELRNIDRERPLINLISIGHVDAGKSTLLGNLLCQMNYVSSKKLAKYKHEAQKLGKSSFAYAWVLDESQEERERGVTTDVAHTYFETKTRRIQLLDAPGHKDFIPSMIGGAAQADSAILVINATKGEFETGFDLGGQTQEHTYLIRVLGVSNVIVAVNKMDTVNWDESRFNEIRDKISKFIKQLKLKASFCPCSGLLGVNIVDCNEPKLNWYKGPTLTDLIDQLDAPIRSVQLPVRISVTDVYKPLASSSYVVAGRIEAGYVSTNNKLVCLPANQIAVVKSIKINSSSTIDESGTVGELSVPCGFDGDHVVLQLTGIDPSMCLEPGSFLSHVDYQMPCSNRIQAKLLIFGLRADKSITRNHCVTFYYQNLSIPARFDKLHSVTMKNSCDKKEIEKKKPRVISGGLPCSALVDLLLDKIICIESTDLYRNIGKFTLRDCGITIAGGTVVKVLKNR